jgi:tetratricopeptide (TPR) repeat protein
MRIRFGSLIVVLTATVVAFLPVLQNGFVNWDDPFTLVGNPRLDAPGVWRWSFTTTEMGHYQPLAWLAWSQWKALFGLDPTAFHALSLLGHLANVAFVYVLCIRLTAMTGQAGTASDVAAIVAAITFAVHPIRVEAVAWASAFPYVLSLALLLLSFLAYLRHCGGTGRPVWRWVSVGVFALSQLARASAPAFPLVLWLTDVYLHRRRVHRQPRPDQPVGQARLLWEKAPFLLVAIGAVFLESRARELATLEEAGLGLRLTLAATAPFTYLWRTLAPVRLSPLDPLPLEAGFAWLLLVPALLALALMTMGLWRLRGRYAGLAVAWAAYLLLLAPVAGLTPSGQQATADRYMYVPGVVLSLFIGLVCGEIWRAIQMPRAGLREAVAGRRLALIAATVAIGAGAALGAATWRQATWWHDSITLWTRAADLDPRNDIATYNLGVALAEAGRDEEAIGRYEQTLLLVPDHEVARRNLNLIRAARSEREGDRSAQAGDLDAAINHYAEALAADPSRRHARAARGIALVRRGRFTEAAADLKVAYDVANGRPTSGGDATPAPRGEASTATYDSAEAQAVAKALSFALIQLGRHADAAAVLTQTLRRYPEDHELAHNLARLLATTPDPAVRDGATALRLASAVRDRTGGRDPRVLDTLAAAYAAERQFGLARETARQAASLATQLGQPDIAQEIERNAREYVRPR